MADFANFTGYLVYLIFSESESARIMQLGLAYIFKSKVNSAISIESWPPFYDSLTWYFLSFFYTSPCFLKPLGQEP